MIQISKTEKKFFVDAMIGNIAKKLRLFGFNTKYSSTISDLDILSMSKNENRILITKDFELYQKAIKQNIQAVFLKDDNECKQFIIIKNELSLNDFSIDGNNTRCSVCNGILKEITKSSIQNQIPKRILDKTNNFWQCTECNKIYWEGTHIINLQNFTRRINDQQ